MLEKIVGIPEHDHREIGLIAEDAGDLEAVWAGMMERGGQPKAVEAAQVNGAVRLQFVDDFSHGCGDYRGMASEITYKLLIHLRLGQGIRVGFSANRVPTAE